MNPRAARRLPRLLALLLLLPAGASYAQNTNDMRDVRAPRGTVAPSDWEDEQAKRNWRELDVQLPPYPAGADLIEFKVGPRFASFRYYVDAKSVFVGKDNLVRFTLVARSPSGVDNVTYEGMRCDNGTYKVLAQGNEGRWSSRDTPWRDVEPRATGSSHAVLRWDFFCPMRGTILTGAEGVDALRRGMHPGVGAQGSN